MSKHRVPRRLIAELGIALIPLVLYILSYKYLPDTMTTHYSAAHGADGFHPKGSADVVFLACLGFLGVALGEGTVWLVKKFPNSVHGTDFESAMTLVHFMSVFLTVLLSGVSFFGFLAPLMKVKVTALPMLRVVLSLAAVGEIIIGNPLPKVPQNPVVGVRLSATMQSKAVWYKVQRFGGRVLMAGGAAQVVIGLLPAIPDSAAWIAQVAVDPVMLAVIVVYALACKRPETD